EALQDVVSAAQLNPKFAEYYGRPDVQKHVRDDMLAVDFTSSMHINRRYFCDEHPTDDTVQAWEKACQGPGGVGHAHHFMLFHIHWSKGGLPRWAEDDGTPYDV